MDLLHRLIDYTFGRKSEENKMVREKDYYASYRPIKSPEIKRPKYEPNTQLI